MNTVLDREYGLNEKAKIINADGFSLPFNDNSFDAVISHNYLSVLSDPESGILEMIRVCKPGGNISVSTSANFGVGYKWEGEYDFEGFELIRELYAKYNAAYGKTVTTSSLKQSHQWPSLRFPKLFSVCKLENISIMPSSSVFAYNDNYWSDEYRIKKIKDDIGNEIRIISQNSLNPDFEKNGFTSADSEALIRLLKTKQEYLLKNYRDDDSWEWSAGLYFTVTGQKPIL